MTDADDLARMRAYLEQHRDAYDRTALRAKLIADGHDPEQVDLAMAQVYGLQIAAPAPQAAANPFWQLMLAVFGIFMLNYFVVGGIVALVLSGTFGATLDDPVGWLIGLGAPLLLFIAEGAAAYTLRRSRPTLSRALTWGLVVSLIPFAGAALLFGVCVAILSGL